GFDDVLELRARLRVIATALIGQPCVVLSFRKRPPGVRLLRIRRDVELLANICASSVVPVLLLVVRRECVERRVEICRSRLADGVALRVGLAAGFFRTERTSGLDAAAARGAEHGKA